MQLDVQVAEEDMSVGHEAVYTADLQVEETFASEEANVEAGSPASSQQRRRMRAHTMRLSRQASTVLPAHARGFSDTTSISTTGRTGAGFTTIGGFTSINAPRALPNGYHEHGRVEAGGVDDDDHMRID
ncbi:hypothetical protein E0Z10_g2792 [Xylaria hypoxylon]|uniref:Uncharacterized protein n=1 Tax=Xylaria hypoxylon TaxID=37992 RepID=A0A4Z0Z949_9PEZI|nr:hypothetical protein E0Z10_g2792 [Xylaria hypoxylon]